MSYVIKEKTVDVRQEVDILVVGGGPAGIGAAVSAARSGKKVMLLEKRGFLGGNITGSYVETCNHFLHGTSFEADGIYKEMEDKYKERFDRSHDIRPNSPHRFSSEYLKIFLDDFLQGEGVELKFHSFVNDVIIEEDKIVCAIIQSKNGPLAIKAKVIIDSTGDGDVAFSAGIPYEQGRDTDGFCQPGTVNFRVVGVDVDKLTEDGEDGLKKIGQQFNKDYRAGKTGLTCKRQDLPFGRLTPAGQVSYINYPCSYMIDPTDVDGLTQGEIECRQYIMEFYEYAKENFEGFENIEIASIAPEIGFRGSRIKGLYRLNKEDIEAQTIFDDAIATYPRIFDMLSPDGYMDGDGKVDGGGYKGHICEPITDDRFYTIPYRSLLPVGIDNLLVAGRCISADHLAESSIRAISACMITGQAAGAAAGLSCRDKVSPKEIDVRELQNVLKGQGVNLPE